MIPPSHVIKEVVAMEYVRITFLILLVPLVHEAGHFLASIIVKRPIKFYFDWDYLGKIKIPSYAWDWPARATEKQIRFICQAGFFLELGLIPFLPVAYQVAALVHFAAYPWYAGEESDFRGLL